MIFKVKTTVILKKPVTTQFICLFFIVYLANIHMDSKNLIYLVILWQ
jgi:hypothetical protein